MSAPAPPVAPIRVVLCDDVPAFRQLMRLMLEEEDGIEVVGEAEDGEAGVRVVSELRPDVCLLDLAMPVCDGLEAVARMRAECPNTHVIALSGFLADEMAAPLIDAGAAAYVEKGADLAVISRTVREVAAS